ncbi:MAG: hypothetical protein BalsKO_05580 [Balneolaceae bacterium]
MGKMRAILFIIILLGTIRIQAQTFKFGDVPREQLEMEVYEKDSSASAVVLFDKGETLINFFNDEFNVKFKRHVRIKILTDEGFEYGDIAIRHRKVEPKQSISKIKAVTYNLDENGSVSNSGLGRRDKHTEKINDAWSDIKFTFPNLKKGSVIEYSYELHSNDPMDFPDWYFQREIPTIWSGYVAQIPEWFNYETVRRGFHFYSKFEQNKYQDRLMSGYGANSYTIDFEGVEYDMEMTDVPALTDEPFMKASVDYLAHMRFQLATIKMPNSAIRYYMGSWYAVKSTLFEDEDLGQRLKSSARIYGLLDEIPKRDSLSVDYMVDIYNKISSSIKWNDRIGIYSYDSLNDILEDGEGSAAGINLLLVQALLQAGFEAYPVVISTRSNGEIVRNLPTLSSFNLTLAYVKIGDKKFVLDAKNQKRPFNIMPASNLNGSGLLIKDGDVEWVPIESTSRNTVTKYITMQLDSVGLQGEVDSKYRGIFAMDVRQEFGEEDSVDMFLEKDFSIPGNVSFEVMEHTDNFEEGLFGYKSVFKSQWKEDNSEFIYFKPFITENMEFNPFTLEERSYPIDFDYPFDKNVIININIPDNWEVDEVPESVLHRLPDRAGEFRRIIQVDENKIVINYRIKVSKDRFMPDKYKVVKDLYDKMVTSLSENIVFKKV